MKAITKLFLVLFAAITCFGCEKIENDNNEGQNTQEDFYYVRFEATSSRYVFNYVKISLTGCQSFSTTGSTSYSEILGPATKGAIADISVNSTDSTCRTAIYVSKNNGPFALKKQGGTNLSYTIDF